MIKQALDYDYFKKYGRPRRAVQHPNVHDFIGNKYGGWMLSTLYNGITPDVFVSSLNRFEYKFLYKSWSYEECIRRRALGQPLYRINAHGPFDRVPLTMLRLMLKLA